MRLLLLILLLFQLSLVQGAVFSGYVQSTRCGTAISITDLQVASRCSLVSFATQQALAFFNCQRHHGRPM